MGQREVAQLEFHHSTSVWGGWRGWRQICGNYIKAISVLMSYRRRSLPRGSTRVTSWDTRYVCCRRRAGIGAVISVWREEAGYQVEGETIFGPNVVSFTVTAGRKLWYFDRAYVPPNNQPTVHQVDQTLSRVLVGVDTLLVGDLNACLEKFWYQWKEDLETSITNYRLLYQTLHFVPRQGYRVKGGWPWRMWRDGRPITGRGCYILGTGCRYFYNICIR